MVKRIKDFMAEEKGQGMVEYGLILAVIALGIIAVLTGIGDKVVDKLQTFSDGIPE